MSLSPIVAIMEQTERNLIRPVLSRSTLQDSYEAISFIVFERAFAADEVALRSDVRLVAR